MQLRLSSIGTLSLWVGQQDSKAKIGTVPPKSGQLTCLPHYTSCTLFTAISKKYELTLKKNWSSQHIIFLQKIQATLAPLLRIF